LEISVFKEKTAIAFAFSVIGPVVCDWLIFCAFPAIFGLKLTAINAG